MKYSEFMIVFNGPGKRFQGNLIARRRIDFTYCPTLCKSYLKTSECTPAQLMRLLDNNKNSDFSFTYNGKLIEDWTAEWDRNLVKIVVNQPFPGYEEEDKPMDQRKPGLVENREFHEALGLSVGGQS